MLWHPRNGLPVFDWFALQREGGNTMAQKFTIQLFIFLAMVLFALSAGAPRAAGLSVSSNKRYLLRDGEPFLYLCDSGWDVVMMCDRDEADEYLTDRANKGFNVIMTILIGWKPHRDERNAYGEPPLIDKDPTRPNGKYFQHVDYIIDKANSLGMLVAIAPSWSDWMYDYVGAGPHPFTVQNARTFGHYVGNRYRDNDIVWVIGGDRDPAGYEDILTAMAAGLDEGDGDSDFLMTFHGGNSGDLMPPENVYYQRLSSSSHVFAEAEWLDFHGSYSGHQWAYPTYRLVARDRDMKPTRPVIDLEPCYENHAYHPDGSPYWASPGKWDGKTRGTAALVREQAYWAMLAGAAGHTYACDDVWGFHDPKRPIQEQGFRPNTPWREAMQSPGAAQMGIMRRLFESREWYAMEPDQSIVVAGQGSGEDHIQAARAAGGEFLMVYLPRGNTLTIDMTKIKGAEAKAHWFNPRDGEATAIGSFPITGVREFSPPSTGVDNDWVLVLDDVARGYPPPG